MSSHQTKRLSIPRPLTANQKGLLIIYTGNGKGKTTAALGTAFRAAGHGMKVAIIQFMKGKWKTGELREAKRTRGAIEIFPMGDGFTWMAKDRGKNSLLARKAFAFGIEKMMSGEFELVIFDEINYALDYGFLKLSDVLKALKQKPAKVHAVLTGRNAKSELIKMADLVTEMKEIKHPFKSNRLLAQPGIDY